MKKLWAEFKEFINRGNAMDLAVAVVIGAAFTAIINSIVGDFITPLISLLTFNIEFSSLQFTIGEGDTAAAFKYGHFIQATLNFILTAVVIFLIIKGANTLAKKKILNKAAAPTRLCPYCSTRIPETAARCPHCTTILDASRFAEDTHQGGSNSTA
ncbi:MAG: large conductance mechanosensitive channel protein MscL [Coriobacteriales bacterium]|jgi:large conductance mechanosensitive channel|nr:large conductance mechanosensitive channel protein MscL [Coriobacteriales bacterium]